MSFADSLNKSKLIQQVATLNIEEISDVGSVPAVMTLSVEDDSATFAAYDGWMKPDNADFYDYYDNEYSDDSFSIVDKNKNITLSTEQINLTQEKNSQYIPFEIPRRYDGFDLANTELSIYWVNEKGIGGTAIPVDVYYNSEKIRFAWLVDDDVTDVSGKINFEIHASGKNSKGYSYLWKTKSNNGLNVLQALEIKTFIEPDETWQESFISKLSSQADRAESAASRAEASASSAADLVEGLQNGLADEVNKVIGDNYYTKEQVDNELKNVKVDLTGYATEIYVKEEIEKIDVSDQLTNYALKDEIPVIPENISEFTNDAGYLTEHQDISGKSDVGHTHILSEITDYEEPDLSGYALKDEIPSIEGLATEIYVQEEIEKIDISDELNNYYKKSETYTKEEVNDAVKNVKVDLTGYVTEEYVDGKISPINTAIATINQTLDSIDKSPNARYETTYNQPYTLNGTEYTGENTLVVYEIYNKDTEQETRSVVSAHVITGGSGGSTSANTIVIERITDTPLVVTADDEVIIEYNFIGTDASGDDIGQGNVTWKLGSKVIKTETVYTGENSANLTEYIGVGSDQKITIIISDDIGTIQQKSWYVSVVDVKLESTFDDTRKYNAGSPVNFAFTPYGAVDKTVHILLDGEEIDTVTSPKSSAGLSSSYDIPAQSHGTHLVEMYMTAKINNNDIESNHIVKDIIWYDESSTTPVIGCINQEFTARQYEATNITYTVYDPSTEKPNVNLKATYVNEDGETVETYNSNLVLDTNTQVWSYKTDVIGEHTLTITCGETVKILKATITELGIEVSPTTAGLEFDFNPVGYSNNDANRIWSDKNTGVDMIVSSNFDWVNGGYQLDENGDQYFCVKAGTTATINYNLFADDAKVNGKEFKVIFKTTNIKNRNTSFISCMDYGIGLDMKVESANIYSSNSNLYSPYCEEDIIEFDFNIFKNTEMPIFLTFEDGLGFRPMTYTSDSSFWQSNPTPIMIGSPYCDVHIYRMKAYSTSLSDKDILNNWIADARSAEEMIRRYEKNQIYKDGLLDPEHFAEKYPDLHVVMIDAPWFTNDKDNEIDDTNITHLFKGGDYLLDNWTCTGGMHKGQGTSSNEYGDAARNIDVAMNTDTSVITLGDGVTKVDKITLSRTSVPVAYLNLKVNVASSEGENNAQHANRYNQFNPFIRYAKAQNSNVKDCMEFYDCVVFIRERDEDISTHREFQDTNWHKTA